MSLSTSIYLRHRKRDKRDLCNMGIIVYNPQKGRLETVEMEVTAENTTWFEKNTKHGAITSVTDFNGGIVIRKLDYSYPVWVYDVTREDIGYNHKKAKELLKSYE